MSNKLSLAQIDEWISGMNHGGMVKDMAVQLAQVMAENERLRETLTIIDMQALNVMQDDMPPCGAILRCGWVHEKCKEALSYKDLGDA